LLTLCEEQFILFSPSEEAERRRTRKRNKTKLEAIWQKSCCRQHATSPGEVDSWQARVVKTKVLQTEKKKKSEKWQTSQN
jgi:hypothetical protein